MNTGSGITRVRSQAAVLVFFPAGAVTVRQKPEIAVAFQPCGSGKSGAPDGADFSSLATGIFNFYPTTLNS